MKKYYDEDGMAFVGSVDEIKPMFKSIARYACKHGQMSGCGYVTYQGVTKKRHGMMALVIEDKYARQVTDSDIILCLITKEYWKEVKK